MIRDDFYSSGVRELGPAVRPAEGDGEVGQLRRQSRLLREGGLLLQYFYGKYIYSYNNNV